MQRTRFGILATCLAALAMAAGCGGGSSGTTDPADGEVGLDTLVPVELSYGDETAGEATPDGIVTPDNPAEIACVPECDKTGDRQCAPGAQGMFQVCAMSDGGCLRWGTTQACPTGQACVDGQCTASCQSDPGCAKAGDRRCGASAAYQECAEVSTGCFKFGDDQPCPGAQVCVGDGNCQCQDACPTLDDRKCFAAEANLYQVCQADPVGCRVWATPVACQGTAVCQGTGVCQEVCTADCPKAGDLDCASGTQYRLCMEVQPGCLKWGEPVACPGTMTCQAGICQVECLPDADCDTVGKAGCADAGHERACEAVLPTCLKWGAAKACAPHQSCTVVGAAEGACACDNPCNPGDAACIPDVDPHFRKTCAEDASGCRYWAYEDCGAGSNCVAGACEAICGSDPDCTAAGITRCESSDSFATCAEVPDHAGCIQFGTGQTCPLHQECQAATGQCACRVEGGCTAAGLKRCIDYDNAATCTTADNGCLYWGLAEPCPEGNTCNDGTCSPLCVSDLDCAAAGTSRCSTDGQLQKCVEAPGAAGCLKWAPLQACPAHEVCANGSGCVCENPCKSGESRCVGQHQRQSCAAADANGCTSWQPSEECSTGDSCVQGQCKTVVSPQVACGNITLNLVSQGYSDVQVSGDFTGTTWETLPLVLTKGVWSVTLTVTAPGSYQYKFVADGTWLRDPLNPAWVGNPPMDNSQVAVTAIQTCDTVGTTQCTAGGTLEQCAAVGGCPAWAAAADPCTAIDHYCDGGKCVAIASPVVTDTTVTFTARDQGFPVEVSGDFTSPKWGSFFPLAALTGRRTAVVQRVDVQGLTPGTHGYKFHAPAGGYWFTDPSNPTTQVDDQGVTNSVLVIPGACVPGCDPSGAARCAAEDRMQTCGADATGCLAWLDGPCGSAPQTYCLRTKCEAFPVIDAAAHTATFVVKDDGATTFAVAGDFTAPTWDSTVLPMTLAGGLWTATSAVLATGTYHYKLVRNGAAVWITDPHNPLTAGDGTGGLNSVFSIP